jgi:hypothetical protein
MPRFPVLVLLAPMLSACANVATIETAVPPGSEVMEPRLVGTWEVRLDTSLAGRMVITHETATQYLVRDFEVEGTSSVFMGRLGPLGAHRFLFELSPVADTTKMFHSLSGDSTRLNPPSYPLMLPIHMPLVIERADSGLIFAAFNGDTLVADLTSGRLRTPFATVKQGDLAVTVLLTERDPQSLNAALRQFADRPGALIWLRRVGRSISLPALH